MRDSRTRNSLAQMTESLRFEFQVAWQQTLQQGNLYPLIEFYNANERELQQKHNVSLNQLIGLNQNTLNDLAYRAKTQNLNVRTNRNPMSALTTNERPFTNTAKAVSWVSFSLLAGGIFLIYKSLK